MTKNTKKPIMCVHIFPVSVCILQSISVLSIYGCQNISPLWHNWSLTPPYTRVGQNLGYNVWLIYNTWKLIWNIRQQKIILDDGRRASVRYLFAKLLAFRNGKLSKIYQLSDEPIDQIFQLPNKLFYSISGLQHQQFVMIFPTLCGRFRLICVQQLLLGHVHYDRCFSPPQLTRNSWKYQKLVK